eukprot:670566-Heterocapsa_arctica.AAC.1
MARPGAWLAPNIRAGASAACQPNPPVPWPALAGQSFACGWWPSRVARPFRIGQQPACRLRIWHRP